MHCRVRMSPRGGVAVRGFVSGRGPPLRGGKDSPERAYRSRGLVRTSLMPNAYCLSFLSFLLFLWPGVLSKKTDKKYENGYT